MHIVCLEAGLKRLQHGRILRAVFRAQRNCSEAVQLYQVHTLLALSSKSHATEKQKTPVTMGRT